MSSDVCILTYNGVDGACAAAAALLCHPGAQLFATSAARVGRTLQELADRSSPPDEIHVCGVGVWCNWREVEEPAVRLRERDTSIYWYCGRGYLDDHLDRFTAFSTPVFLDLTTNTAAVCQHLSPNPEASVRRLQSLAQYDPNNDVTVELDEPTDRQRWWMDYIEASVSQYFKYQDAEAYTAAVRKLADNRSDHQDQRMVEVFRRSGKKYVLRGQSDAMQRLRDVIRRCGETDEDVLITGESGVGKEYVAHLLHERSRRATGPMIPVNCAVFAGNEGLANSVLFGHRKGAFTGATENRPGAFLTADSGILFLDEVGELPPSVQAKFLRVLEDGWVTPEGADRPQERVDVRVIAATKRDLPEMLRQGTFRDDLYHRLDTLRIQVPPLRQHPSDIPAIAQHSIDAIRKGSDDASLLPEQYERLCEYHWPGNVRQLLKVLKRMVYLDVSVEQALREERQFDSMGPSSADDAVLWPGTPDGIRTIEEVKCRYASRALELCGGNRAETARKLDISPNTLRSYLNELE